MLSKEVSSNIFLKSLVWLDLGLNPGLPDHWRTLYPLGQWVVQKFYNILVLWRTIWLLWMHLQWLLRWWTTLDCEMPSLPDTLQVVIGEFTSIAWHQNPWVFDLAWLLRFLATQAKFLKPSGNCTVIDFTQQMVLVAFAVLWSSLNS